MPITDPSFHGATKAYYAQNNDIPPKRSLTASWRPAKETDLKVTTYKKNKKYPNHIMEIINKKLGYDNR